MKMMSVSRNWFLGGLWVIHSLLATGVASEESATLTDEAGWTLYDQLVNIDSPPVQCESVMVHRPDADTAFIPVEMKGRVWKKGRRSRTDEQLATADGRPIGKMTIGIVHPDSSYAVYEYDSANDTYRNLAEGASPIDVLKQGREKQVIEVLGTEVLSGLETTMIEIKSKGGTPTVSEKVWIGNSTGLVMRSETRMAPYSQFRELKNCVFEEFPDSALDVPQDKVVPGVSTRQ